MKRIYLLTLLFGVGIVCMLSLVFPALTKMLEGNDFFLMTWDYFLLKLNQGAGINGWLTDYILQYFKWPLLAGVIYAILAAILIISASLLLKQIKQNDMLEGAVLPLVALLALFPFCINLLLEGCVFYLAFLVYIKLGTAWKRICFCFLYVIVGMFMVSVPLLGLNVAVMVIWEYIHTRKIWLLGVFVGCMGLIYAIVQLLNAYVGFIPFEMRYFHTNAVNGAWNECLYLLIFLLPFLSLLMPEIRRRRYNMLCSAIAALLIVGSLLYSVSNPALNYNERCYKYVLLTENKAWEELRHLLESDDKSDSSVKQKFALLMESVQGTLPERLFDYKINTPEDFLFRFDRNTFSCLFNALFYENAAIYDEAFHQFFEYSMQMLNGNCFMAMRHMIQYSIQEGDLSVAEKYLDVLAKSSCHSDFIQSCRSQVDMQKKHKTKSAVALRGDNFVGCYPFNSEMVRQLQEYPQNKIYLDYLLCGLLLQKNLVHFKVILEGFPLYKNTELPKAYAEACALMKAQGAPQSDGFVYPEIYDRQLRECYQAYKDGDSYTANGFANTFWNYYFYAALPEETQVSGNSAH